MTGIVLAETLRAKFNVSFLSNAEFLNCVSPEYSAAVLFITGLWCGTLPSSSIILHFVGVVANIWAVTIKECCKTVPSP